MDESQVRRRWTNKHEPPLQMKIIIGVETNLGIVGQRPLAELLLLLLPLLPQKTRTVVYGRRRAAPQLADADGALRAAITRSREARRGRRLGRGERCSGQQKRTARSWELGLGGVGRARRQPADPALGSAGSTAVGCVRWMAFRCCSQDCMRA